MPHDAMLEGRRAIAFLEEHGLEGTRVCHVRAEHPDPIFIEPNDGDRILVFLEENAEALIKESGRGNYRVDIVQKDNSRLKYLALTMHDAAIERRAVLARDSDIEWIECSAGRDIRSTTTSELAGEGASARLSSVFLGTRDERYTIRTNMIHSAGNTTSNMLTRAVMLDESRGDYAGLIKILPDAAGCDAYQKEDTLLLSRQARMHAEPNLEIANENVRCSHGVGLGQIDEEQVFYLLARGIARNDAISLIVTGFLDKVIDHMGEHGGIVKEQIRKRLAEARA